MLQEWRCKSVAPRTGILGWTGVNWTLDQDTVTYCRLYTPVIVQKEAAGLLPQAGGGGAAARARRWQPAAAGARERGGFSGRGEGGGGAEEGKMGASNNRVRWAASICNVIDYH